MTNVGGLSIHCVDVANGRVAVGLGVALFRLGEATPLVRGAINSKGLLNAPVLMSDAIGAGGYDASVPRRSPLPISHRRPIAAPSPAVQIHALGVFAVSGWGVGSKFVS
jgi:hypothetical protein